LFVENEVHVSAAMVVVDTLLDLIMIADDCAGFFDYCVDVVEKNVMTVGNHGGALVDASRLGIYNLVYKMDQKYDCNSGDVDHGH